VVSQGAPVIEQVLVGGTAWNNTFLDYLDAQGLGHPTLPRLGYAIPEGGGQLDALPWMNVNQLTIVFSEDVTITESDLSLLGVNVANYVTDVGFVPGSFVYDNTNFTATWTLQQQIGPDKLLIHLPDTIENLGGSALDGEWQDDVSTVSGDGAAGGDFNYRFNLLPADANQDGFVTDLDLSLLVSNWQQAGDWSAGDFNGDYIVTDLDLSILVTNWQAGLPTGEPSAPAGSGGGESVVLAQTIADPDASQPAGRVSLQEYAASRAYDSIVGPAPLTVSEPSNNRPIGNVDLIETAQSTPPQNTKASDTYMFTQFDGDTVESESADLVAAHVAAEQFSAADDRTDPFDRTWEESVDEVWREDDFDLF